MEPSLRQSAWVNSVHTVYRADNNPDFYTNEGLEKQYATKSKQKLYLPLARLIPACWLIEFLMANGTATVEDFFEYTQRTGKRPKLFAVVLFCFNLPLTPHLSEHPSCYSLTLSFHCAAGTACLQCLCMMQADGRGGWSQIRF